MRLAVIGATGMLGHHVAVAASREGHELVVTYRNLQSLESLQHLKSDPRQADLNDRTRLRTALTGVDADINCAGYYPTMPRPWRDEVRTATAQMDNFYSACADLPLRK